MARNTLLIIFITLIFMIAEVVGAEKTLVDQKAISEESAGNIIATDFIPYHLKTDKLEDFDTCNSIYPRILRLQKNELENP